MARFLYLFLFFLSTVSSENTLKFVQIWFRHGERLPTHYLQLEKWNTSTDYLDIAQPGELTNKGIDQEYRLGQRLRGRYGQFLGEYQPNDIHIYTGVDNRTVASSQALMAGLFPPGEKRLWNKDLLWQPVSMHTDASIDWVSTGIEGACPTYQAEFFNSADFKSIPNQLDPPALAYFQNVSGGYPKDNVVDINRFIDSLNIRLILNDSRFPFPSWAEPLRDKLPGLLYKLHDKVLDLQNETVGGYHIEKVLSYMEDHLQRPVDKKNKAVFLGAHDTNMAMLTKTLNLLGMPKGVLVGFASYLAVELHQINGVNQVKFFFSNTLDTNRTEIKMAYCGNPCTLEGIQALVQGYRTSNAEMLKVCMNIGPISTPSGLLTGILIGLVAVFLLTTVIFGCTAHSYKAQLRELNDPERTHLLR